MPREKLSVETTARETPARRRVKLCRIVARLAGRDGMRREIRRAVEGVLMARAARTELCAFVSVATKRCATRTCSPDSL